MIKELDTLRCYRLLPEKNKDHSEPLQKVNSLKRNTTRFPLFQKYQFPTCCLFSKKLIPSHSYFCLIFSSHNSLFISPPTTTSMHGEMRSSRVVRAFGCQCQSRNWPGFDTSILRLSGSSEYEALLKKLPYIKNPK